MSLVVKEQGMSIAGVAIFAVVLVGLTWFLVAELSVKPRDLKIKKQLAKIYELETTISERNKALWNKNKKLKELMPTVLKEKRVVSPQIRMTHEEYKRQTTKKQNIAISRHDVQSVNVSGSRNISALPAIMKSNESLSLPQITSPKKLEQQQVFWVYYGKYSSGKYQEVGGPSFTVVGEKDIHLVPKMGDRLEAQKVVNPRIEHNSSSAILGVICPLDTYYVIDVKSDNTTEFGTYIWVKIKDQIWSHNHRCNS